MNVKPLTINGIIRARYEIDQDQLFIKCDDPKMESLYIEIIEYLEQTEFGVYGFLNVDLETGKFEAEEEE